MSAQGVAPVTVGAISPQKRYGFQTDPFHPNTQTPVISEVVIGANIPAALSPITIDRLLSSVALTRVDKDGQRLGFRVSSNTPDVRLIDFGLKDGDVFYRLLPKMLG